MALKLGSFYFIAVLGIQLCSKADMAKPLPSLPVPRNTCWTSSPFVRWCPPPPAPFTCSLLCSYSWPGTYASRSDFIAPLSFSRKRNHFQIECYFYQSELCKKLWFSDTFWTILLAFPYTVDPWV